MIRDIFSAIIAGSITLAKLDKFKNKSAIRESFRNYTVDHSQ